MVMEIEVEAELDPKMVANAAASRDVSLGNSDSCKGECGLGGGKTGGTGEMALVGTSTGWTARAIEQVLVLEPV